MSDAKQSAAAPVRQWLAMPMDAEIRQVIERIRRADDVVHVAVMPDVHLAGDVCVGVAMATSILIYPSAVGGDIGCGMLAVAFDGSAEIVRDAAHAGGVVVAPGQHRLTGRRAEGGGVEAIVLQPVRGQLLRVRRLAGAAEGARGAEPCIVNQDEQDIRRAFRGT